MAIDRMICRRWKPRRIHSDNGTNFVGAKNELKAALQQMDQEDMKLRLSTKEIDWTFIPPSAPHMGGSWERLVQTVKVSLHSVLKEKAPKEETLLTFLIQVENIVNSRPITHLSGDPADPDALTPNDILKVKPSSYNLPGSVPSMEVYAKKQWQMVQLLAQRFWERWLREYLPTLNRRSKWHRSGQQLAVGDLVFIADGNLPRGSWPKGRIVATFPGKDGNIRVVDVKTQNGLFRRHVAKLLVPCSGSFGAGAAAPGGGMSQGPTSALKTS
jgi:hypothetical protein